VASSIQNSSAIAVSDGSYIDTFGTAAWIIESEELTQISGRLITPGEPKVHSSYRSELSGLHCIIYIMHKICQFYNISEGEINFDCDSESAIDQVFQPEGQCTTDSNTFDLVGATQSLHRLSPIQWSYSQVIPKALYNCV
jgi:hypothetical protein